MDYSIKQVCEAAGLNPSTLRTWERRYGFPQPVRTETGRRRYTQEDVERIQLVVERVNTGEAIGDLVTLSLQALREHSLQSQGLKSPSPVAQSFADSTLNTIQADILAKDLQAVRRHLQFAIASHAPLEFVVRIASPLMRWLGESWHSGTITISLEHAVTVLIRQSVFTASGILGWQETGPLLLFGTHDQDRHDMGLFLAWYLALHEGFHAIYLGESTTVSDLAQTAVMFNAAVLITSAVYTDYPEGKVSRLNALARRLPEHTQLWIGGPAASAISPETVPDGIFFHDYESFVRSLRRIKG